MFDILAHAGEAHESAIEATTHELAWYVQLALFLMFLVLFMGVLKILIRKTGVVILITASILLVAGFALFRLSPIVSATAITLGLFSTLFLTLVGLGDENKK